MNSIPRLLKRAAICAAAILVVAPAIARAGLDAETAIAAGQNADLSSMSLEDLMNVEVTSVSRYKQKASEAPAAVTVISQDDIAQSGLHSIPELMRLSPGLDVARLNAHDWAISSRGFNDLYANKLLVLIDGRTVYAPLFSGVAWDQQQYLLQDLERIEVIRGPGATMWGANAVNGVINITSKSAQDTQGLLVTALGSNVDSQVGVRYGGKLDDKTFYRVFGQFQHTDDFVNAAGDDQFDGWHAMQGGFRIDRMPSPDDTLTLQGESYQNLFAERNSVPSLTSPTFTQTNSETNNGSGADILGRWTHTVAVGNQYSVQLYYDRFFRHDNVLAYTQDTYDAEFQHHVELGTRNTIIWGAGARYLHDSTQGTSTISFDPGSRDDYRLNTFVQDDFALVPNRFHIILGSKFEYTSYSEFEYQPSARFLWTPNQRNSVWGAISRAIHNPTRVEQDATTLVAAFPGQGGVPAGVVLDPNRDQESAKLIAYELGYRLKPRDQVSIDIATFFNHYEGLRNQELIGPTFVPTPAPHVLVHTMTDNSLDGESYGVETGINVSLTPAWRVSGSYSFLEIVAHTRNGGDPTQEGTIEGGSPRNQVQVHSYYRLTRSLDFDASAYYVESLSAFDVPSYIRVDLGVTWRPKDGLAVSVGVQNLLDDHHPEMGGAIFTNADEFPRTFYGQVTWQY